MFAEQGWQVAEPGESQRPPLTYRSDRKRLAEMDSRQVLLEVTCDGGRRHPHDLEVLLVAGRDLRPGGTDLYLRGAEWEYRNGADGFRYWPDYPARTSPKCPQCPARPRFTESMLRAELDRLLVDSAGAPVRHRTDYRSLLTLAGSKTADGHPRG